MRVLGRGVNHTRGFTIGDDFPDDLPPWYELAIGEWGALLYNASGGDKVIPDSCVTMKSSVQNYEGGQGYKAIWGVIKTQHTDQGREFHSHHKEGEGLEEYFFCYRDYLCLKTFLTNTPRSMDDPKKVTGLTQGTINSFELCQKTGDERGSTDVVFKFDTSQHCAVCGRIGHNFNNCALLDDIEGLKKYWIKVQQPFFNRMNNGQRKELNQIHNQVTQVETQDNCTDPDEWKMPISSLKYQYSILQLATQSGGRKYWTQMMAYSVQKDFEEAMTQE
eukprot:jgi/Psemu1/18599/gm1.18599_g